MRTKVLTKAMQVMLSILCGAPLAALNAADSHVDADWRASWIGIKEAPVANQWICYRKVVHLKETPRQAKARIAADSKYWLWINGKMLVFEGQLKRGRWCR